MGYSSWVLRYLALMCLVYALCMYFYPEQILVQYNIPLHLVQRDLENPLFESVMQWWGLAFGGLGLVFWAVAEAASAKTHRAVLLMTAVWQVLNLWEDWTNDQHMMKQLQKVHGLSKSEMVGVYENMGLCCFNVLVCLVGACCADADARERTELQQAPLLG